MTTVDREARAEFRRDVIDYMSGAIRAFEFDDRNSEFCSRKCTADDSVRQISKSLYYLNDDFIDHSVSVDAEGWV